MPQRFTGTAFTVEGKKLDGARVILKKGSSILQETKTDKEGTFNLIVADDVESSDVTLTISKDKYTLYNIKNPQPTSTYNPPTTKINPISGGFLDLKNSFDAGKYLITSLNPEDQEQLYWEIFNIIQFINANPNNYEIVVISSESFVTNYDREQFKEDGSENPNWAGPTGTFKPEGRLNSKALSEKRYNSLKTYIQNIFNENGAPLPNIKSNILVGGPSYDPSVDKADDSKYKAYQYVRLEARLISVNCETQAISENTPSVNLNLIKPPGATKITINALEYPDQFGINGKLNNFYTQSPTTKESVESWGFIIYLNKLLRERYSLVNDTETIKTPVNLQTVISFLEKDSKVSSEIREQLLAYIYFREIPLVGQEAALATRTSLGNATFDEIIQKVFEKDIDTRNMFIYLIKRENTVIRLNGIGDNSPFILNSKKGNIIKQSAFEFNICDNRT